MCMAAAAATTTAGNCGFIPRIHFCRTHLAIWQVLNKHMLSHLKFWNLTWGGGGNEWFFSGRLSYSLISSMTCLIPKAFLSICNDTVSNVSFQVISSVSSHINKPKFQWTMGSCHLSFKVSFSPMACHVTSHHFMIKVNFSWLRFHRTTII